MTQAKQRNPNIKLYGLPWTFPAWVGNNTWNPYAYPNLTAGYIVKWVEGAKTVYNLDIDYIGIWNERSYNITYIETLRAALDAAGFDNTMIIASDRDWTIAQDILDNPTLAAAVYAIGARMAWLACCDERRRTLPGCRDHAASAADGQAAVGERGHGDVQ